jgi:hypothetical protein
MTKRFTIHFCPLDRQCRQYGAPARLSLSTPWWYAGVALTPGRRYAWTRGKRNRWTDVRRKEQ